MDGVKKYMPTNCVWFKPTVAGVAALAFVKTNNSNERIMAIYKYERLANGTLNQIEEKDFVLNKSIKNGSAAYYEYTVTQADVDAGYEYAIGSPSADSTTGFIAMALAGTDTASDNKTLKVKVDYITDVNQDVSAEDYTIHQTILEIASTTLSGDTLVYLVYYKAMIEASGSSKVNYYSTPVSGLVTDVSSAKQSLAATDKTPFEKRQTTATASP
ncbi:MAG: hypothetical protein SOT34_04970 [Candidatus Borkfalkiaceae bacterium]|nr:hypothetical protein [Christensenellaceae bacterium]